MYIANNETAVSSKGILNYMPQGIRRYMYGVNLDGEIGRASCRERVYVLV